MLSRLHSKDKDSDLQTTPNQATTSNMKVKAIGVVQATQMEELRQAYPMTLSCRSLSMITIMGISTSASINYMMACYSTEGD